MMNGLTPTKPELPMTGTRLVSKASRDKIDYLFIKFLRDDDYQAFEQLFLLSYHPLRNFCKKIVHINEVAEELVSEVFFKIWNNRKAIVINSSPKSYLFAAVHNISLDHLRKEKRYVLTNLEKALAIPSSTLDPQKGFEYDELQAKIEMAVARLPRQCKQIFQLSREQGLRYNEIAEKLQLSVKTIETQMGRALKSLRKSLG
jgi:RNA polymerase sigma-70 factor (ECF subfamily)